MYLIEELLHFCSISVAKCRRISEHVIDYYDLTFVLEGEMNYVLNGEPVCMQKNDMIFLPPGTRRARREGISPVQYVSFNFRACEGVEFPFEMLLRDRVTAEIRNVVLSFPTSHLSNNSYSVEKCTHLLGYVLFAMMDFYRLKSTNEHVLRMVRYVDLHIAEKITLGEISCAVGLTREYASYLFSREIGQTLTDYVNEQKLLLAREMLIGDGQSLADVAHALGFENYHYFSRIFKKQFGISPVEVKNKLKK